MLRIPFLSGKQTVYHEIQNPRQRYALINHKLLMQLLNIQTVDDLSVQAYASQRLETEAMVPGEKPRA